MTSQQSSSLSLVITGFGHNGVGDGADGLAHIGIHTRDPLSQRQRLSQPSSIQSPSFMVMLRDVPKYVHSGFSAESGNKKAKCLIVQEQYTKRYENDKST